MEGDIEEEEIHSTEEGTRQVHRETQMQWMSTEGEGGTGSAISVESLAIWPEIVGKEIKQE